jgi:hypothetical protein
MSETTAEKPTTTAADNKPRTAAPPKAPVVDPAAPYGYMTDPKTGETRPKRRPGKQGKTVAPPRSRPDNKARSAKTVPGAKTDYTKPVMDLLDGLWTLGASIPTVEPGVKVLGIGLHDPTVRVKAQMAILKDNGAGVVNGIAIMAKHSEPVRNFVVKAGDEAGPAWILPAMMALLPFVAQSAMMWRAPVAGEVEKLAARTEQEFDDLVKGAMAQAEAEAEFMARSAAEAEAYDAANPEGSNGSAPSTG